MADDIKVTVRGRVATEPTLIGTKSGAGFTQFRMAHTPRRYDAAAGTWSDGQTEWFTVVIERDYLQSTARFSLHKGVPVIVIGRLRTARWRTAEGVERWTLELRAETVGVDLAHGIASYARMRPSDTGVPAEAELVPTEPSEPSTADASERGGRKNDGTGRGEAEPVQADEADDADQAELVEAGT